jgi:hypothetical protein
MRPIDSFVGQAPEPKLSVFTVLPNSPSTYVNLHDRKDCAATGCGRVGCSDGQR